MLRRLIINFIFILAVTLSNIAITFGSDVEKSLQKKDYFPFIYDYKYVSVGDLNICKMYIYNNRIPKGCELDFKGDEMDYTVQVINLLNQITYVETQPNPAIAFEYGGNCQAITLLAHTYFDKADIENDIVVEKDHMYNTLVIDGQLYKLDITNSIFVEGGQNEKFRKDK